METKPHPWWQKARKPLEVFCIIVVCLLLLALLVVIVRAYVFNVNVPGLRGKTLWDWLQLLIIPAVLAVGGYVFNYTTTRAEQRNTQLRDQTEQAIASDNQEEAALQAYIDSMSELLLHEKLRESAEDDEVQKIARVRTLTVLPRLDKERKKSVLQFLYESGLIYKTKKIIDLRGANLSGANLSEANLSEADLSGADLSGADLSGLSGANLSRTNLSGANLSRTKLSEANLSGANLHGAILNFAKMSFAYLSEAYLSEAELSRTNLWKANLGEANLEGAYLSEADLSRTNLSGAILSGAILHGVNLSEADLSEANLSRTNLWKANLSRTNLKNATGNTTEQLDKAKSLQGAIMPDGSTHP